MQLQSASTSTATDADAFSTSCGGVPSIYLGLPNRYMHTPVEVVDTADLTAAVALLGAFAADASEYVPFTVDF